MWSYHLEETTVLTTPISGTSTVHFNFPTSLDPWQGTDDGDRVLEQVLDPRSPVGKCRGLTMEWETVSEPGAAITVKTPRKTHRDIVRRVQRILEELKIPHSKSTVEDEDCTIFFGNRCGGYREIEVENGEVTAMVEESDGSFTHLAALPTDKEIRKLARLVFPPESPRTTLRRYELAPVTPWFVWPSLAAAFIILVLWLLA